METTEPTQEISKQTTKQINKRKSYHKPAKSNEIYIKREKRFAIYLKRAMKLLTEGQNTIFVYGMGATIEKAVKLALKIQKIYCGITFDIKTSSVKLIDDVKEEGEEGGELIINESTNIRTNSAISIKIVKD